MDNLPERFKNREGPRREIAGGVVSGLGGAAPPSLSIKGGSFTLIDAAGEQEAIETKYVDVVIVDVNLTVPLQRVFWGVGARYNESDPKGPLCFSFNGVGASSNAREPQSDNCKTCAMAQWDSDVSPQTGKGVPACKVYKYLAVLPVDGDQPYYDMPFQLRVPVMSHAALQTYGNQFRGKQFDVSDVVTRISFTHGKTGQLEFEARKESPWVTDEVDALVNKILDSRATDGLVGRNDTPVQRKIAQPTGLPLANAPQEQPKQLPQAAPVDPTVPRQLPLQEEPKKPGRPRKLGSKPAAEPAATPQPAPKPAPATTARPLPSFLQPKGDPTLAVGQGNVNVGRQPAASDAPSPSPPSELQAALTKAFNLKV